jgi:hypothetical protein
MFGRSRAGVPRVRRGGLPNLLTVSQEREREPRIGNPRYTQSPSARDLLPSNRVSGETLSRRSLRTTPFVWRCMHSPAYTCIHVHFGDFTCVHLRSPLLISLQLRLQLESEVPGVPPQAFEPWRDNRVLAVPLHAPDLVPLEYEA